MKGKAPRADIKRPWTTTTPSRFDTTSLILISILVLSAILNLMNIRFGLPYIYGRNVEGRIATITVDAFVTGDLNPHVAIYPHLQLYLLLSALLPYYLWGRLTGIFASRADIIALFHANPTAIYTIFRTVTALFGTGCVLMTYLVARRLYGKKVGLLAAFLLTGLPLLITNAHMVTPDVIMTFFILASFYFAIKVATEGKSRDYFLSGAMVGLGFTSKYPAAIAVTFILCAHLYRTRAALKDQDRSPRWSPLAAIIPVILGLAIIMPGVFLDLSPITTPLNRHLHVNAGKVTILFRTTAILTGTILILLPYLAWRIKVLGRFLFRHRHLALASAGCVLLICLGSPYLWIDFSVTLNSLIYHALTESKPFWGSEETPAGWITYLSILRDGTSLPFVLLSSGGVAAIALRHRSRDILLLSFPAVYYLFMGSFETKIPRYMIPILPFLSIFVASLPVTLRGRIKSLGRGGVPALFVLISLLSIPSLISSLKWDTLMGRTNTRTLAKEWIEANIARGSRIALDALGPPLSESDYQLFVAYRGKIQPIDDPWTHYRLGEAGNVDRLLEEGIQYAIVNSDTYRNYFRVPDLYPKECAFYLELDSRGHLIRTFKGGDNPGPDIKIYSLIPPGSSDSHP
jgi:hypothetical protein